MPPPALYAPHAPDTGDEAENRLAQLLKVRTDAFSRDPAIAKRPTEIIPNGEVVGDLTSAGANMAARMTVTAAALMIYIRPATSLQPVGARRNGLAPNPRGIDAASPRKTP